MFFLYILYSEGSDKYYVGHTENPSARLRQHNFGVGGTFTSKHRPWEMVVLFQVGDSRPGALKVERFIKRQKSRKLIEGMVSGVPLSGFIAHLVRVPYVRD